MYKRQVAVEVDEQRRLHAPARSEAPPAGKALIVETAYHVHALRWQQRLIAAQKPNLQLCWKFLEEEIARVRAAEKVNPTRTTPVKTPSRREKHTPTPTKKATPERHGTHAALPESKSAPATYGTKKTTPEHGKKPAPIREPPKEKPSLVQRGLNAAKRACLLYTSPSPRD